MDLKFLKKSWRKVTHDELLIVSVLVLLLIFHSILGTFVQAQASWYNASWDYRKKITIDATNINSALSNFPVLVNSTQNDWKSAVNGGHVQQADGGDILFTADDGTTKFSHELESYDPVTGEIVAWVNVTSISDSADTELFVYYGYDVAPNQWEGDGSTWNPAYKAVHHFDESCSSADCLVDSTISSNDGTPYSDFSVETDLNTSSGKINGALNLDGNNDQASIADSATLDLSDDFTLEAWVKPGELNRYNSILNKESYALKIGPDDRVIFSARVSDASVSWSESEDLGASMDQVKSFAVFDGYLYASGDALNQVQRTQDGVTWSLAQDFDDTRGVILAVFDDYLYAAVSGLSEVWRSSDGTTWTEVADLNAPDGGAEPSDGVNAESGDLLTMAVFNNSLYVGGSVAATSETEGGEIFKTSNGTAWTEVADFNDADGGTEPNDGINDSYVMRVLSMTVYDGYLYAGVFRFGTGGPTRIYRTSDGFNWSQAKEWASPDLSQVNALAVFADKIYSAVTLSTSSDNDIYSSSDGTSWASEGFTGTTGLNDSVVFSLVSFYGQLYAGTGSTDGKMWDSTNGGSPWSEEDDPGTVSDIRVLAHAAFKGIFFEGTGDQGKIFERNDAGIDVYSTTELDKDTWTHVAVTYDKDAGSNNVNMYINGSIDSQEDATITLDTNTFALLVGNSKGSTIGGDFSSGEENMNGIVDELRISSSVRGADWISASYINQNSPSTFYTIDLEEDQSGYAISSSVSPSIQAGVGDGVLTLTMNGELASGINVSIAAPPVSEDSATWTWSESTDYLSFHDSTNVDGFRVNLYMSSLDDGDFVYSGSSEAQGSLDVSNLKVWGGFDTSNTAYVSATMGLDSSTATLNIDSSASCASAQSLANYSFNGSFTSSTSDYGLTMSSAAQGYVTSTVGCIVEGSIDIRRFRMTYPAGTVGGNYTSNLFLVIVDGT